LFDDLAHLGVLTSQAVTRRNHHRTYSPGRQCVIEMRRDAWMAPSTWDDRLRTGR
jgi:hypothetical protein